MYVKNITNLEEYIPLNILTITSDLEFGTHVYFRHGYDRTIEFGFYTESEDLKTIIEEIILRMEKYKNDK